ncbi:DUF2779 domain-containing protein [Mycoplasma sp. ATU-Cv-508]|uniref:DUF2779 domain-containing protein n=1 Tax=Mycoplasma sp. ATU-Cv-508 TaxID=2048001 RepID=UPI000FDEA8D0
MSQPITSIHFKRLISSQPYLVWNPLPQTEVLPSEEFNFDEDSFLDNDLSFGEAVFARAHQILMSKFLAHLIENYPGFQVVSAGESQKKINQTNKYYQDPEVEFIYNPVWSFDYQNYQVLANPIFYDKKTATVAFIKLSTSTKRSDLYKIYFDVQVMLKLNIPIKDVVLYIVASKNYRRGEVDFFKTTTINLNKSSPKASITSETDFFNLQQAKVSRAKGPNPTLYEFLIENRTAEFEFASFNFYLDQIISAAAQKTLLPFRPCYFGKQLCYCTHWKEVVQLTANPVFHNWNNRIIVKKFFHEHLSLGDIAHESLVVRKILKANGPLFFENVLTTQIVNKIRLVKERKVVWYDFEAYTLPVAPLDHYLPFTQVVYQISLIKTDQEREVERHNHVFWSALPYNWGLCQNHPSYLRSLGRRLRSL